MKPIILTLFLMVCAPFAAFGSNYKHKSEAEISSLTPAQRVEEFAQEQVHHRYDVSDQQGTLLEKWVWRDSLAALPRMIEIMDEYDPTRYSGKTGHKGERFDAMSLLMVGLDDRVIRLRATEEGRGAIDALQRAINRMATAGHGKPDLSDWSLHLRNESSVTRLEQFKGISLITDPAIRDTLRREYMIQLSDEELLTFVNFLVVHYPTYPSWSETDSIRDNTRFSSAGYPLQIYVFKRPERFHEAYLEFKKPKR